MVLPLWFVDFFSCVIAWENEKERSFLFTIDDGIAWLHPEKSVIDKPAARMICS